MSEFSERGGIEMYDRDQLRWMAQDRKRLLQHLRAIAQPNTWIPLDQEYTLGDRLRLIFGAKILRPTLPRKAVYWSSKWESFSYEDVANLPAVQQPAA